MDHELLQLINNAPDAILIADRDGKIRYWNKGAEQIFGYGAIEAVGCSLDLIIPQQLRGAHWQGYNRVMAEGLTHYSQTLLSVPGVRKNGSPVSLEFSVVLIKDGSGAVTGCGAVIRDVTKRWEREKALKKELAECNKKLAQYPVTS